MKRTALSIALILTLLCSAIAGQLCVNLGKANPYEEMTYDDPPIISVYSPMQNVAFPSNVLLNFTVTKSDGWLIWANISSGNFRNKLSTIDIIIDGHLYRQIVANSYLSSPFIHAEYLKNLTVGNHTLTLQTHCEGWNLELHGFWSNKLSFGGSSNLIDFAVNTISLLSPENKTYGLSDIPLNFIVTEPGSRTSYSLDGQDNVTIAGNMTLTDLLDGEHSLTLFAIDNAGNTGTSETLYFTVDTPEPSVVPVIAVVAVVVGAVLLLYFKKRKH